MVIYDCDKPQHLNSYFMSIFFQKGSKILAGHHCAGSRRRELQFRIDKERIKEHLDNLNEFKSPEPDKFQPRVLKEQLEVTAESLIVIFEY